MKVADILAAAAPRGERFSRWLDFVLEWECVFDRAGNIRAENVPGDAGGLTFAGIDSASHRGDFPFANPTPQAVARIYFEDYWQAVRAEELSWPVGEVVANFAVNMGVNAAGKLLQTAINQLPGGGECRVDGAIGPKTIAAAKLESPRALADLIEDEADERYRGIVRANPGNKKFLAGWLNRDDALERWWMSMAA